MESELGQKDDEIAALEGDQNSLEFSKNHFQNEADELRQQNEALSRKLLVLDALEELPQSLGDVVSVVALIHADRLVVLPGAQASAQKAAFTALARAWKCLRCLADDLWELAFADEETGNLQQEFQNQTGFALALSEGKQTKKDGGLMGLWEREYEGRKIDISVHVKCDAGREYLRIHFFLDNDRQQIVIGHCGDHLTTSGTLKMR